MIRMRSVAIVALAVLTACGGSSASEDVASRGLVAVKRSSVDGPGACGVNNAYIVTEAGGVALSRPAIMTMRTARALDRWVRNGAIPAIGERGGGLAELTIASHYACRTRNSRAGAKLSEHAKGRAIDISSFVMRDGSRITVLDGWDKSGDSRLLRRAHKAACGTFGTVLGPESDQHHQDHFHFDVADRRGGAYCR